MHINGPRRLAAFVAMLVGGATTVTLEVTLDSLPLGLDGNVFGIGASALVFVLSLAFPGAAGVRSSSPCHRMSPE